MCRELHALEPHCKWVLLHVALLTVGLARACAQFESAAPAGIDPATLAESAVRAEVIRVFDHLSEQDAIRRQYYADTRDGLLSQLHP